MSSKGGNNAKIFIFSEQLQYLFGDSSPTFTIVQEGASMGLVTQPTTALVGELITHKVLRALVFGHNPIPCQRTVYQKTGQKKKVFVKQKQSRFIPHRITDSEGDFSAGS